MRQIQLGPGGRTTTQLGFGCSSLMGAMGRRASLATLEAAFDAGIRHFDVAPMYGYGEAESCLGEFLKNHPGTSTVTTKYGIPPARNRAFFTVARQVAGPVIKLFPALKSRLSKAASLAQTTEKATFTVEQASASLDGSLRALRTDYIDIWLLHEVTSEDLHNPSLFRYLQDTITQGKIGAFGIASDRTKLDSLLQTHPEYCQTIQYQWSILDPDPPITAQLRIQHRSLTENFRKLHTALAADPGTQSRWSALTGKDLANPRTISALMLRAALDVNAAGVVLFSSKNPGHIQQNVDVAGDDDLRIPAEKLKNAAQNVDTAWINDAIRWKE